MILLATLKPSVAALADGLDSTVASDTETNGSGVTVLATAEVSFGLTVTGEHGTIEAIVFEARSLGSAPTIEADSGQIHWVIGAGTEGEYRFTADGALTTRQSPSNSLTPDGAGWTWQDLAGLTMRVHQDGTLSPGQSCSVTVADANVYVYGEDVVGGVVDISLLEDGESQECEADDLAATCIEDGADAECEADDLEVTLLEADETGEAQA